MLIGLKIFVTSVGIYAGVRLAGVAMEWIKKGIDNLRPNSKGKYY